MEEIQVFNNERFGFVGTLMIDDEPWLVGKDVAEALGYSAARNTLATHVDDDDKLTHQISAAGQRKNGWLKINEFYEDGTVTETYER